MKRLTNLLEETIFALYNHDKMEQDVRWVGTKTHKTTWEAFKSKADTEYDSGYGTPYVAMDLMIVGDDWWLERMEYDGAEAWCFKTFPPEPTQTIDLKVLTSQQAKMLGVYVNTMQGLLDMHYWLTKYLTKKDGPVGHDAQMAPLIRPHVEFLPKTITLSENQLKNTSLPCNWPGHKA
jgi:hypothetical protein